MFVADDHLMNMAYFPKFPNSHQFSLGVQFYPPEWPFYPLPAPLLKFEKPGVVERDNHALFIT
jgi:hypothetical protein